MKIDRSLSGWERSASVALHPGAYQTETQNVNIWGFAAFVFIIEYLKHYCVYKYKDCTQKRKHRGCVCVLEGKMKDIIGILKNWKALKDAGIDLKTRNLETLSLLKALPGYWRGKP